MTHALPSDAIEPVTCRVPLDEIEALRLSHERLQHILAMATDAFERSALFEPAHVPLIALAAKIMHAGSAGPGQLGQTKDQRIAELVSALSPFAAFGAMSTNADGWRDRGHEARIEAYFKPEQFRAALNAIGMPSRS